MLLEQMPCEQFGNFKDFFHSVFTILFVIQNINPIPYCIVWQLKRNSCKFYQTYTSSMSFYLESSFLVAFIFFHLFQIVPATEKERHMSRLSTIGHT